MERLTMRTELGEAITNPHIRKNGHKRCLEKLAHYEDLEEQGRLITLPCKVDDTVYIYSYGKVYPLTVKGFETNKYEIQFKGLYCGDEKELEHLVVRLSVSNFGKTIFLTKEEAEQALAEVQKG